MAALEAGVATALQDKGAEQGSFQKLLGKRYEEYSHYRKWLPGKDEAAKGTLFWEFAKKVAAILGVGPNIVFNTALTNELLSAFVCWNLDELFAAEIR